MVAVAQTTQVSGALWQSPTGRFRRRSNESQGPLNCREDAVYGAGQPVPRRTIGDSPKTPPLCNSVPGGPPPPMRIENPIAGTRRPPRGVGTARGGGCSASTRDSKVRRRANLPTTRRRFTGQPPWIGAVRVTAAFHGCRSGTGADRAPAGARCSSAAGVLGSPEETLATRRTRQPIRRGPICRCRENAALNFASSTAPSASLRDRAAPVRRAPHGRRRAVPDPRGLRSAAAGELVAALSRTDS
jgi:hypothetical protein